MSFVIASLPEAISFVIWGLLREDRPRDDIYLEIIAKSALTNPARPAILILIELTFTAACRQFV